MTYFNAYLNANISAISSSLYCIRSRLFDSFNLKKWIVLGFISWVAIIYQGSAKFLSVFHFVYSSAFGVTSQSSPLLSDIRVMKNDFIQWIGEHLLMLSILAIATVLLFLFLLWIGSIAEFVFLDTIANNDYDVVQRWNTFRARGFSLFLWRIGVYGASILLTAITIATSAGLVSMVFYINDDQKVIYMISVIILFILIFSILLLILSVLNLMLEDFAIPFMYKYDLNGFDAISYSLKLLKTHWLGVAIFWFSKGVIRFSVKLLFLFAIVFSLFLIVIPYRIPIVNIAWDCILTIIILPIPVFYRSFGPLFLHQLNDRYEIIGIDWVK